MIKYMSRPKSAAVKDIDIDIADIWVRNIDQGDHSPDNVKFPDNSMTFTWRFATLLPMLNVTHIRPVLVLLSVVGVGMQQCMIQNQNEMHKLSKVKNGYKCAANHKQF